MAAQRLDDYRKRILHGNVGFGGGSDNYAAYLEDDDGYQVELVAD